MKKSKISISNITESPNNTLLFPDRPCQNTASLPYPPFHKKSVLTKLQSLNKSAPVLTDLHMFKQICIIPDEQIYTEKIETNLQGSKQIGIHSNVFAFSKTNLFALHQICWTFNKSVCRSHKNLLLAYIPYIGGRGVCKNLQNLSTSIYRVHAKNSAKKFSVSVFRSAVGQKMERNRFWLRS